jgi:hypothetical protein
MTKEEAIIKILKVLNSRMAVMSPAKNEALNVSEQYGITATDLIEAWSKLAMRV